MSPRLNQEQLATKKPTMWDSLAKRTSLVGYVDGGSIFAHTFGYQACTQIARRLGNPEDRP
jgi:hypothetical protein